MHIQFQMYSCGSDRDIAIFILYSEETWVLITIKRTGQMWVGQALRTTCDPQFFFCGQCRILGMAKSAAAHGPSNF